MCTRLLYPLPLFAVVPWYIYIDHRWNSIACSFDLHHFIFVGGATFRATSRATARSLFDSDGTARSTLHGGPRGCVCPGTRFSRGGTSWARWSWSNVRRWQDGVLGVQHLQPQPDRIGGIDHKNQHRGKKFTLGEAGA